MHMQQILNTNRLKEIQNSLQDSNSLEDYIKRYTRQAEPAKIAPYMIPQKSPFPPNPAKQDPYGSNKSSSEEILRELLLRKSKSPFEEILDSLFDNSEKEQFLIDSGYEFYINSKGEDMISKKVPGEENKYLYWSRDKELDSLFIKEISIKFKNLLIRKEKLKLKL